MSSYDLYSQTPGLSGRISPQIYAGDPITPVRSPHHSVTSSAASRTPIHTLTIHEYRKQQHTPLSHNGTPPGKTLRRKAAAATLTGIEHNPSLSRARRPGSASSLRPLHFSQSAYHLKSSQSPFQQHAPAELALRSQSTEPRIQTGSISSVSTINSVGKVRHFNSRKRLPRPAAPAGPPFFPLPPANMNAVQSWWSPLPAALRVSSDNVDLSDAQTTPTPPTFSLSRFPHPPHHIDPPFPPPPDANDPARINALSFSTSAPATPPVTPAIIHYRGASFDLVNPHDSLHFHDIVTPSKDFESSDYLPLLLGEESFRLSSEVRLCLLRPRSKLTST